MEVKVEVRPIEGKKWHGKTGKESFTQAKTYEVLYDDATGRYQTGLTEEEAEKLSKETGLDLSDQFIPDVAHPYWSTKAAAIKLENHTMFFDTGKPLDLVKIKNMKASKYVANSLKDYEEGLYPDATHIIYDETEQIELKASKIELANTATLFSSKMNLEDKIAMVRILSKNKSNVNNRSANFITVEIDEIIKNDPEEFMKYAQMGREEVSVRAKVLECLQRNILTKEGTSIYYMGDMIAFDYEDAVKWFKDPQNSKMKVVILEKLQK